MALLGTFINAGAACMALGQNCFAHSLPTTPDFVAWQFVGATVSIPDFNSRGSAGVFVRGPAAFSTEGLFASFHSIIR